MAKEGIMSMQWAQEVQKPGARTLGKLEKPEGQSDWSTKECVRWGLSFYSEPRVKELRERHETIKIYFVSIKII